MKLIKKFAEGTVITVSKRPCIYLLYQPKEPKGIKKFKLKKESE